MNKRRRFKAKRKRALRRRCPYCRGRALGEHIVNKSLMICTYATSRYLSGQFGIQNPIGS